jgi:RNA polymerase sigma factor (sigma-70 family)
MVSSFVKRNSGSDDDAQDLFQEVMVVLFENANKPGFALSSSLKTYLYGICRNKWLMVLRARKSKQTTLINTEQLDIPSPETIQEDIIYHEKNELLRIHFQEIGEDCQKIMQSFLSGISLRDIATEMGFTEGYAKKRKFICQKRWIEMIWADPRFQELRTI